MALLSRLLTFLAVYSFGVACEVQTDPANVIDSVRHGGGEPQRIERAPAPHITFRPPPARERPAERPRFISARAQAGVVDQITAALAAATAAEAKLVVYVGASWCEPCQYFHRAVTAGKLDEALSNVRFLEFDADVDGERLAEVGFDSHLIPLFVVPDSAGRPTDKRIEGGIKGPASTQHIMARLTAMLARPPG